MLLILTMPLAKSSKNAAVVGSIFSYQIVSRTAIEELLIRMKKGLFTHQILEDYRNGLEFGGQGVRVFCHFHSWGTCSAGTFGGRDQRWNHCRCVLGNFFIQPGQWYVPLLLKSCC